MKKKSIYLDTSVSSSLFDNRTPERQHLTKLFWDQAIYGGRYAVYQAYSFQAFNSVEGKAAANEL